MTSNSTNSPTLQSEATAAVHLLDDWFDPIEAGLRDRVREFIQVMIESELEAALSRPRYGRRPKTPDENAERPSGITGHRHGHRSRALIWPEPTRAGCAGRSQPSLAVRSARIR